ncbi:hypothetical protein RN001_014745 [Aquatica leii]|uniref:SHSP domain-containing protein n=1 Tax=Aquatica leii TaxID=1421715 RepID=A0AAN7S6C3_9COLE|nr:hypothetical protein RN001_014745 [Aquatica leii]
MSLLPIIVRDIERPLRMLEQQIRMAEEMYPYPNLRNIPDTGKCSRHDDYMCPFLSAHPMGLQPFNKHETVTQDNHKFQVKMDLKHFTPEEITVKAVNEKTVVIEAKHESKDEKGSTSRQFLRQFVLPEGHDIKKLETKLSVNGVLTITAPTVNQPAIQDRVIPVIHE